MKQYVAYRAPEVAPVGGKSVLVVGFDVSFLRRLDVLQGDGSVFVVIERRQHAGLDADVKFLHLRRIETEIMPAEGPHAHGLHLALEDVDEHRQFVKPRAAEEPPPDGHTVVVGELAAVLQAFVLQHVGLKVFGISVHRAELVNAYHVAVVPDAVELDQQAVGGVVVPDGCAELAPEDVILAVVEAFVDHLESGPVHPPEKLHAVVGAVLPFRHPEVEPLGEAQLRADPVPEVVERIHYLPDYPRMGVQDDLPLEARGA